MKRNIYIMRWANELPKVSGFFYTDKGTLWYNSGHWSTWSRDDFEWWLEPAPAEGMTLEEAKQTIATKEEYSSWLKMHDNVLSIESPEHDRAAELYLASNTATLLKENKELKAEMKMKTDYYEEKCENLILGYSEENKRATKLEQQVTVLREALEKLQKHLKSMGFKEGVASEIIETALQSLTK